MDALNLPSLSVQAVIDDGLEYLISADAIPPSACPHCGGSLVGFGRRPQTYADLPMHGLKVRIQVSRRRWRCKQCEKVTLDPLPDMDDKRAATVRLVEYVRRESLRRTFVSIAEEVGILINTVRGIFLDYVAYLDTAISFLTPRVLGIDEIHLIGEARCVLTNVGERTLIDILPSRIKEAVYRRLVEMPDRHVVEVVTIDMTRAYKECAEAAFPNAVVVVDKWHVLRMANQCLESVRKSVREGLTPNQRRQLMHDRFILLKRRGNLNEQESIILDLWSNAFPLLREAYDLKESLYELYGQARSSAEGRPALEAWRECIPPALREHFKPLTTALKNWETEIAAHFDHRYTNAYTEAMNGLIRVTDRMGRGYSFDVVRAKMLYSRGLHKNPKFMCVREGGTGEYTGFRLIEGLEVAQGSFGPSISTLYERLNNDADDFKST